MVGDGSISLVVATRRKKVLEYPKPWVETHGYHLGGRYATKGSTVSIVFTSLLPPATMAPRSITSQYFSKAILLDGNIMGDTSCKRALSAVGWAELASPTIHFLVAFVDHHWRQYRGPP